MNSPAVFVLIFFSSAFVFSAAVNVEEAIKDVLKEVLGVHPPQNRHARTVTPPKHMLALYHKYASGKGKRSTTPSTVRNILPIKGPPSMADLVLFNVSSVDGREEVRLGQLHINRRRLHQRHFSRRVLAPPYRVRVYRVTGNRLSSLGSIPIPQVNKAAWHAVDITSPLKELLLKKHNSHILGIRFEAPRGKPLTPKHFLRDTFGSSSSFLVIFSEESSENDINENGEIQKRRPFPHTHDIAMKIQSKTKGKWINENTESNSILPQYFVSDYSGVEKNPVDNFSALISEKLTEEAVTMKPALNKNFFENRQKRSVETIELAVLEPGDPEVTPARSHLVHQRSKGRRGGSDDKKKIGKSSKPLGTSNEVSEASDPLGGCRLQNYTIKFTEIGWDFVVAPPSFEANYCTGSCSYPVDKDVLKTNHAIVQSFVRFIGKTVPSPSCTADELKALSLLYVEDDDKVILRNYPDMAVASCSCH